MLVEDDIQRRNFAHCTKDVEDVKEETGGVYGTTASELHGDSILGLGKTKIFSTFSRKTVL